MAWRVAKTAVVLLAFVALAGGALAWRHPLFRAAVRDVVEMDVAELRGAVR